MILLSLTIIFLVLIYHIYNIFQQFHYNYKLLMCSFYKLYTTKPFMYILYISLIILIVNIKYSGILIFLLSIISLIIRQKYIIKLNITNRIIRLFLTTLIIYILIIIVFKSNIINILFIISYPFILYLVNTINKPIENIINRIYINKAKVKLKQNKNLIKIAITGSFGKTTIKNILNTILRKKYITLSTPKSYNTLLGITKTINQSLTNITEVLIVEMGASNLYEIEEMKKLIDPDISIISEIGMQHMSTFKSMVNVLNAKLEIINFDKRNSITIVNSDNIYLNNLNIKDNKLYKVGINKFNNNIYVKDINILNDITKFNIVDESLNKTIPIKTHLLGYHNINNILLAYQTSKILNIDDEDFIDAIYCIEQIENRLSYKRINNIHIYDDSYNSNINGFKNAIKFLNQRPTKKVIITPGIVDSGNLSKIINEEIAKILNESNIDDIYLIKNEATTYYENILDKYKIFNSFKDAYNHFLNTYTLEEVSLLIENDLPDNYFER